jgi:hypothetical protein
LKRTAMKSFSCVNRFSVFGQVIASIRIGPLTVSANSGSEGGVGVWNRRVRPTESVLPEKSRSTVVEEACVGSDNS